MRVTPSQRRLSIVATMYRALFEAVPSGVFGVPENGMMVLPARPGGCVGDAFRLLAAANAA